MKLILPLLALLLAAATFGLGQAVGKRSMMDRIDLLNREVHRYKFINGTPAPAHREPTGHGVENIEDPLTRQHLIQQIWYADQKTGNSYIAQELDHEWGPRWNRRNPIFILEEQIEVMQQFLRKSRELGRARGYQITWPTEETVDPADGSRIYWENHVPRTDDDSNPVWFGKHKRTGEWMAYEFEKGVFEPDQALLAQIEETKRSEQAIPPAPEEEPAGDTDNIDPFAPPE